VEEQDRVPDSRLLPPFVVSRALDGENSRMKVQNVPAISPAGSGGWGEDRTLSGFDVPDLRAITERHVILPKLFRRLGEFMRGGGSVAGFKQFLELRREPITILPTAHFTHFDTIIEVSGDSVRMTEPPENVVFAG
jgi:hypothetical protein